MATLLQTEAPAIRVLFGRGLRALLREVVSKAIPTSVDAPENQGLLDRFTAALVDDFRAAAADFPMDRIVRAINNAILLAESDGDDSDAGAAIDAWLDDHSEALGETLADGIEEGIETGAAEQMNEFFQEFSIDPRQVDIPGPILGPSVRKAIGEKIGDLNATNRKRLQKIIRDGIENRDSVDQIANDLFEFINDDTFMIERARRIARTETNEALSAGARLTADRMGATEKQWITAGDIDPPDPCLENEGQGKIPIDDKFGSGDDRTPQHPNCKCAVTYHGANKKKVEGAATETERAA